MFLSKIYIFMYFFYSYFGYNHIYRLNSNKQVDCACLNPAAYSFIGKRLLMLSHLTFLYSAFYLEYSNINRYLNVLFLNLIVNSGYYIKWGISEYSTFYMHIFWGMPVFIQGLLIHEYQEYNMIMLNNENYFLVYSLLIYCSIHKKIYTKRIAFIDNPA